MLFSYLVLEKFISDIILKIENGQCAFSPNGQAKSGLKRQRETEVASVLPEASLALGYPDIRSQNMPSDDIQF